MFRFRDIRLLVLILPFSIDEGYQSVRKWTSRLDIFSKKFLIVPINEKYDLDWNIIGCC
jgi:Ulp1 family protease